MFHERLAKLEDAIEQAWTATEAVQESVTVLTAQLDHLRRVQQAWNDGNNTGSIQ